MSEATVNGCAVCGNGAGEDGSLKRCARCRIRGYCSKECQANDWASHKLNCKRPNYLFKVVLCPADIKNPDVFRTLSCPANATFEDFHKALQIAFGWASTHTFDFKIKDPAEEARVAAEEQNDSQQDSIAKMLRHLREHGTPSPPTRYLLRIIEDDPHGPGGFGSGKGVDFMHNKARQHPQTPEKLASKVRLFEVLYKQRFQGKPFEYEYDFGDCWTHDIVLVRRDEATANFKCIDGAGHYVAEDVGSTRGWERLKAAYAAREPDEEQRNKMRWFEEQASNCDERGLGNGSERSWAKDEINRRLGALAVCG